jgi:hypothetical protein
LLNGSCQEFSKEGEHLGRCCNAGYVGICLTSGLLGAPRATLIHERVPRCMLNRSCGRLLFPVLG